MLNKYYYSKLLLCVRFYFPLNLIFIAFSTLNKSKITIIIISPKPINIFVKLSKFVTLLKRLLIKSKKPNFIISLEEYEDTVPVSLKEPTDSKF